LIATAQAHVTVDDQRTASFRQRGELWEQSGGAAPLLPLDEYILEIMKQILVELDDAMAAKLEEVAPARSRRRSEFVRSALSKALWDLEEQKTAEAYRRQPDSAEDVYFDPDVWERKSVPRSRKPRRR